jgi:hypothetical protein
LAVFFSRFTLSRDIPNFSKSKDEVAAFHLPVVVVSDRATLQESL